MSTWIDFKQLRQGLKFRDLLSKYQIRLSIRQQGKQAVGPCPLPAHSGSRTKQSFSANLEKGLFQCFSCNSKGNALDFACLMEGRDPENGAELRRTALELAKEFKIETPAPNRRRDHQEQKIIRAPESSGVLLNAPLNFELKGLDSEHEYLKKTRKLDTDTIRAFGLGFCCRGRFAGRIAIPLHNLKSELVGYAGRHIDDAIEPKYLLPSSRVHKGVTHEFRKSFLLYNAHRIQLPATSLIVVEGFSSVWWLHQNGFPNSVALMGSSMSVEQKGIISSLVKPGGNVILLMDGDRAGQKAREIILKDFGDSINVVAPKLTDDAQPTSFSQAELRSLLTQSAPEKIGTQHGSRPRDQICKLINAFPCFASFRITPANWSPEEFERQSLKFSSGEIAVAQFILGVWNPTAKWQCGRFDLIEAAGRLDEPHRKIIISWFADPWWP